MYNLISFVSRGKIRKKVLSNLTKPNTPTELSRIIHNFVNPHLGLNGKTPAEAAEIDLKLGRDKLLNLIRKRAKKMHHSLR